MFTIEELSIIAMYSGARPNRNHIITALEEILPLIEEEEIRDIVLGIIRKANAMTEEDFSQIDLSDGLEDEESESVEF